MMLNQLISALRQIELMHRMESLQFAQPQVITPKKEATANMQLHIVYVLNHVGMCGGTKIIFEHANHLTQLGAKVTLVAHFPQPVWYTLTANYITVPFQMELTRGIPVCDVIVATYWEHIHACVGAGIAPVVYFEQGDFHLYDWEQDQVPESVKNAVNRQYTLAPYIATVSGKIAELIKTKFGREAQIFHNALDTTVFYPKERQQSPAKKYMLIVGREQTPFKGIADLKKVQELLKQRGYEIELLWITQQQPLNYQGEVVINPPFKTIGELYRRAFVYVCGSYYEAFPLPPLEAMACGTPVITTKNIGVQEYAQDGVNCLMAEPGDIEGLADRVIQLLADQDLYCHLQQGGYQTANHFKWEKIAKQLLAYYQEIAQCAPAKRYAAEEWQLSFQEQDFIDINEVVLAKNFLYQTSADEVLFPVQHNLLPGRWMINWQSLAKRKHPGSGYVDKVPFRLKGERFPLWEGKLFAELYQTGKFSEVLQQVTEKLEVMKPETLEWAAAIRWGALCLLELERYDEAETWLDKAIAIHFLYTDLLYIKAVIQYIKGQPEQAGLLMELCAFIQDAAHYPEYFTDMQRIAYTYLDRRRGHD